MNKKGLSEQEVISLREKYGYNELEIEDKETLFTKIIHILLEPMFLLLLISVTIYFLVGKIQDGLIMLIFVVVMMSIEIIEEWKTDKTLQALKELSEPKVQVIRDGEKKEILSRELVPNDIVFLYEGTKIPADGFIIQASGLKVDESMLTGESVAVWKDTKSTTTSYWQNNYGYQGTLVTQGTGLLKVDKIGKSTEYGKIGENLRGENIKKTPLQKQVDSLVQTCAILAFIFLIIVFLLTFIGLNNIELKQRLVESLLTGITLAMAMLPEEFPVVLTVFLSMAAWRLAKKNSLVKKISSVETLGAISVLCVDKTGTLTKNKMKIQEVYTNDEEELAKCMCLASEENAYEPMEKAMFQYAKKHNINKKDLFTQNKIKTYPFSYETKMMGNVWQYNDRLELNVKGSSEYVLKKCNLSNTKELEDKIISFQNKGLRVLAIAKQTYKKVDDLPPNLNEASLEYIGLVGFLDPPREGINSDIQQIQEAGIKIIMITGDHATTAQSIATSLGINNPQKIMAGEELDNLTQKELENCVQDISIFSRVIPEHKMRIVSALQQQNKIVAMTGDGVNDAPALKKADIGIAMGHHGNEVARNAADLILMDDNFHTILTTIKDGRRIYENIKKAFCYILIIHIPIVLSAFVGSLLKINPSNLLLLPVHIVLLELVIDPTCSIVLERQIANQKSLVNKPRDAKENILSKNDIFQSVIQGIVLFVVSFSTFLHYYPNNIDYGRTMAISILIFSNLLLVHANREYNDNFIEIIKRWFKDPVQFWIQFGMLLIFLIIIYSPIHTFFKLTTLPIISIFKIFLISFFTTFWLDIIKTINKLFKNK